MKQDNNVVRDIPEVRYEFKLHLTINEKTIILDSSTILSESFNEKELDKDAYLEKELDKLSDSELYEGLVLFRKKQKKDDGISIDEIDSRERMKTFLKLAIISDILFYLSLC